MNNLPSLAAKSIHINTKPPPRNLSESRQILSALQKFGEVVTFRNLKYDTTNTSPHKSSTTVAIFDSSSAAAAAIAASPLQIPITTTTTFSKNKNNYSPTTSLTPTPDQNVPSGSNASSNISDLTHSINPNNPTVSTTTNNNNNPDSKNTTTPLRHNLTCIIEPSRHNHSSALPRNPFYATFELEKDTPMYRDLVENSRIPVPELADVPTARKRATVVRTRNKVSKGTEMLGAMSLMRLYREGFVVEREQRNQAQNRDQNQRQDREQGGEEIG